MKNWSQRKPGVRLRSISSCNYCKRSTYVTISYMYSQVDTCVCTCSVCVEVRTLVPGYVFVHVARNVAMPKHVVERRLDSTYSISGLCKPMSSSSRPSPTPSPRWRLHCGRNRKRRSVVGRGGDEHEVGEEGGTVA